LIVGGEYVGIVVVSGSAGLIGSEAAMRFHQRGYETWGIDNDMRSTFFGQEASTLWMRRRLERSLASYRHWDIDIRDRAEVGRMFTEGGRAITAVIHAAAQPSHDWAAGDPHTDFEVNAVGTLNLLEGARHACPEAPFVFLSTNKVYGDSPNRLPFVERESRFELPEDHTFHGGIPEDFPIDRSTHSLFGVSKASADLLVQEYGRYFGMPTACFRGGCLTGPGHSGTELHGFLAYLMKCTATGRPYTVFGYQGKQVRDNIHSADLIAALEAFIAAPRAAAVYNIGGGRESNCSMLEAIALCEKITGRELDWTYSEENRVGDHIWWISDLSRFQADYPEWQLTHDVPMILQEIHDENVERWQSGEE
jgi:CDP-paratose 2-epimerase